MPDTISVSPTQSAMLRDATLAVQQAQRALDTIATVILAGHDITGARYRVTDPFTDITVERPDTEAPHG